MRAGTFVSERARATSTVLFLPVLPDRVDEVESGLFKRCSDAEQHRIVQYSVMFFIK